MSCTPRIGCPTVQVRRLAEVGFAPQEHLARASFQADLQGAVYFSRRSMRRLPLTSFRPKILFTRKSSLLRTVKFVPALQTPKNAEGFEFFQKFIQANIAEFACSRIR